MLLWLNSTLGLMAHWWTGTRQQLGRSIVSRTILVYLPCLDVRCLTPEQVESCHDLFERLREKVFLPANEAYSDPVREELDIELLEILGFTSRVLEPLALLRRQWCEEPSVHGGKKTRPQG